MVLREEVVVCRLGTPLGNRLVVLLQFRLGRVRRVDARATVEPGVLQDLSGREAFARVEAQQVADETLGTTGDGVGQREVHFPDLSEQHARLAIVERVPPQEHSVQHDAQTPQVGLTARVIVSLRVEDLGADVGGAALRAGQLVVLVVVTQDRLLQSEQL